MSRYLMLIRHSQYMFSFIINVPSKDIFHAIIVKMGFTVNPKVKVCV